ncbi:MAG: multidrug ABC transporter [Eubacteriales bacterium]
MNFSYYDLLAFLGVCIASVSQMLLKKSANTKYHSFLREYCNVFVIGGYGLMVVATMFGVMAYRGMDYMNGPIIESMGYILVMALSLFLFKEKITRRKLLGTACILLGIGIYYFV